MALTPELSSSALAFATSLLETSPSSAASWPTFAAPSPPAPATAEDEEGARLATDATEGLWPAGSCRCLAAEKDDDDDVTAANAPNDSAAGSVSKSLSLASAALRAAAAASCAVAGRESAVVAVVVVVDEAAELRRGRPCTPPVVALGGGELPMDDDATAPAPVRAPPTSILGGLSSSKRDDMREPGRDGSGDDDAACSFPVCDGGGVFSWAAPKPADRVEPPDERKDGKTSR